MYKCHACGKQFQDGERVPEEQLWKEYLFERRTYSDLARIHRCSISTIQRRIGNVSVEFRPHYPDESVVIIDTTYFGRAFGVMIFQDSETGRILLRKYVRHETNKAYLEGLDELRNHGTLILGVVCDGHKGLMQSIGYCPVQMCQFHQIQIIRRYLTKNPHLIAARELLCICINMKQLGSVEFQEEYNAWSKRWEAFLNERTVLKSGKTTFTHRRLRKAKRSIDDHLPWLFTYEAYPELMIPNTTNKLEGTNSEMKRLMRNHNGLSGQRRITFLDGFLETWRSNPNKEG